MATVVMAYIFVVEEIEYRHAGLVLLPISTCKVQQL